MDKDIVDCSFCREPQLSCCFFFLSHESMIELCWLPSVALQEDQEVLMLLDFMNNIAKCFFLVSVLFGILSNPYVGVCSWLIISW